MTNSPQPKAISTPALLVYGKPASPDLPQASWFRAEDRPTVAAAAQSLKFSVLDIQTEAEKALTVGVHEGVLKGNGRMIVGSVTPDVYKRIEEYAAKASPAPAAASVSDGAAMAKMATEQNGNKSDSGGGRNASRPKQQSQSGRPDTGMGEAQGWRPRFGRLLEPRKGSRGLVACGRRAGRKKRDRTELA